MKVYFSGNFFDHGRYERALKPIAVNQPFQWGEKQGFLPAVYLGRKGIVLDLCIRIPLEKVERFLEDWGAARRTADLSDEEMERMERENPFHHRFDVELTVDGETLRAESGCGTGWHPLEQERDFIDEDAKRLVEEYGCDRTAGWYFWRRRYGFERKPILQPENMTLRFEAPRIPVAADHFVTEEGCGEQMLEIHHPGTGKAYQLTIFGMEPEKLDDVSFPERDRWKWPGNYQRLSYSVLPEIPADKIQIQDCAKSDRPIKVYLQKGQETGKAAVAVIGGAQGPTSVFLAGKYRKLSQRREAYSSLHFEKQKKVEWRVVFWEKGQEDGRIDITL